MASIGWIDFSPAHRARVSALLDALKPEGVVDELGIGTIRDSLADLMFPGFSTIQTRAKYFFIVPYILYDYQRLPAAKRRTTSPAKYLADQEDEVMWQLAEKYNHNRNSNSGVIGITKHRGERIARRPSTIYWNGLRTFKIIEHNGLGLENFLRLRNRTADSMLGSDISGDDQGRDDADAEHENLFRLKVEYDPDWRNDLDVHLSRTEAHTLNYRFRDVGKGLLLGELLENAKLQKVFLDAPDYTTAAKQAFAECSPQVQNVILMAHDFSEVMYGAHIAYNYFLQQAKFENNAFQIELNDWHRQLKHQMLGYSTFNPDTILRHSPRTRMPTQQFIRSWWAAVKGNSLDMDLISQLVANQERQVKRHKARLSMNKLDDVKEEQWVGLSKLNYRLSQVKQMINDIKVGERRRDA